MRRQRNLPALRYAFRIRDLRQRVIDGYRLRPSFRWILKFRCQNRRRERQFFQRHAGLVQSVAQQQNSADVFAAQPLPQLLQRGQQPCLRRGETRRSVQCDAFLQLLSEAERHHAVVILQFCKPRG